MTGLSQERLFFLDSPSAMAGGLATNGSMYGDYFGISKLVPLVQASKPGGLARA